MAWDVLQAEDSRLGNTRSIIELCALLGFAKTPSPLALAKRMLEKGQEVPITFEYTQKPKARGVVDPRVNIKVYAEILYKGRATYGVRVGQQELALEHEHDVTLVNGLMSAILDAQKGEAATWLLRREAPIPVHISYLGSRVERLDLDLRNVNEQYRAHLSRPSISFTPAPRGVRNVNAGFELRFQAPRILQRAPYRRAFDPNRIWDAFAGH